MRHGSTNPSGANAFRCGSGSCSADAEFLTSTYGEAEELGAAATLFANAGFGFPGIYGLALP